ncbi:MAG: methionine adenosyltransferase, partial [Mycoplasmatales bacterium]
MQYKKLFTSESVTEGHPDKVADQISDAILDAILQEDKEARVACETFVTTGLVLIGGEISTTANVDYVKIARDTIKKIGYTRAKYGFDAQTCSILVSIDVQSPDISQGVDLQDGDIGAGDQGIMFGYATDETETYMPITIFYAHKLAKQLAKVRKEEILPYLRPDGKTQITFEFNENNEPLRVDTIVISAQHSEDIDQTQIHQDIIEQVIKPIIPNHYLDKQTKYLINPTGKFIIGGPMGDAGLTGRKIIIDTYGGVACHGGGAFSGKDYTKDDRSAAYAARYLAKNIVGSKRAKKCPIQLSYSSGVKEPISISIDPCRTSNVSDT